MLFIQYIQQLILTFSFVKIYTVHENVMKASKEIAESFTCRLIQIYKKMSGSITMYM